MSYYTTPGVGGGVGGDGGVSKCLSFYIKVFYVMSKALSGELSCPCDRSCWYLFLNIDMYLLINTSPEV